MKSIATTFFRLSLSLIGLLLLINLGNAKSDDERNIEQEFYEIRIYRINDYDKQVACESYLENALLPALNRMDINRVGVFTNQDDENDHSVFVIIPFATVERFTGLNQSLAEDKDYQSAAADYFARELKDPVYERIESRFLKAFVGMPVMEIPELSSEKQERIFELRLYQSHTEDHARRKVQMFKRWRNPDHARHPTRASLLRRNSDWT